VLVPTSTLAHDREMGEGAKRPISKEELDLLVQGAKKQGKEKIDISNSIIQGNDLIKVIQKMDVAIRIRHTIIEGGLDFGILPSTPLEQVELPPSWRLFGTVGEPGDTRGGARYIVMYGHLSRCSSHRAFPPDVPGTA
jgi:hypothetical protein